MVDRPIIFSAPMVRALLAGTKRQTRRLAFRSFEPLGPVTAKVGPETPWCRVQPGDRLWVREAWASADADDRGPYAVAYMADHPGDPTGLGWRPSIHMPRWASRLTLVVTEVRRQRLQEISEEDARAEGIRRWEMPPYGFTYFDSITMGNGYATAREAFQRLWGSLHGDDAWARNEEVVALTFTVHRCNVEAMERAAA